MHYGNQITYFVVEYPSKNANEGSVLWDTETPCKEEAARRIEAYQKANPAKDYEVSDLAQAVDVFLQEREAITAVLEAATATKH